MAAPAKSLNILLRPRARGWIHFYSTVVAIVAGITLAVVAGRAGGSRAFLACSIYAITIVGLFAISSTYHRHEWVSIRARTWMMRADHSMIFVFIAGTYTPFALLGYPSGSGGWLLLIVWLAAAAGVALKMVWPRSPDWLGVPLYLALGCAGVFIIPNLVRYAGVAPVVLMCAGGLFYTVGAVLFSIRKPNPWPTIFGYHEFFHAFVSLAALCHCVAIWLILFR